MSSGLDEIKLESPSFRELNAAIRGMGARLHAPLSKDTAKGAKSGGPLKRIVVVGAGDYTGDQLSLRDRYLLAGVFNLCRQHQLEIAPDFEIITVDLARNQDFLNPDYRKSVDLSADILISALIPTRENGPAIGEEGGRTSPYDVPGAWRAAALETGARLVITCNNSVADNLRNYSAISEDEKRALEHFEINASDFMTKNDNIYARGPQYKMNGPYYSSDYDGGLAYRLETVVRRDWKEGVARLGMGSR